MAANLEAQHLLDLAQRIGLINREQAKQAFSEAQDGSLKSIERVLSRRGMLTSWQLDKLRKNEMQGFFYGKHRVSFHIAEGTFARVYRGETETGSAVAIKVLRNRFVTDRTAVDRFHKEAEAGMRLLHPNIVRIFEFGETDNRHFMAMEFVEGSNLRDFLKRRVHLPYLEAFPLMLGLARGLRYSQEHGVTHRDIKATNILISSNQQAKLVDFGLATIEELGSVNVRTVDYSALERNSGSPKGDPRSDIYFMGCVYYQMLTGLAPMPEVESADPLVKMLKRSFGAIVPLRDQRHGGQVPEGLVEIIDKMMQVDLKKRFQSMAEVVGALESYENKIGSSRDDEEVQGEDLNEGKVVDIFSPNFDTRKIFVGKDDPDEGDSGLQGIAAFQTAAPSSSKSKKSSSSKSKSNAPAPDPDEGEEESGGEIAAVGDEAAGGEISAFVQRRVLCVESQEMIREAFRKQFEKMGYRVLLIADSEQAVERFKALLTDAIVFDADGLPSGALEDFREIQRIAKSKKHPLKSLILLGPKQAALSKSLEGSRTIVLTKPVKLREINEALERLISHTDK